MVAPDAVPRRREPTFTIVVGALIAWAAMNLGVLALANGYLPFDRPNMAGMPFLMQVAMPSLGLIEQLALMGVVWLLTRNRRDVDMAARAPEGRAAIRETVAVLAYAMAGQVGGWLVGPLFGYRPFSFHLAGTLVGCSSPPSPGEALVWMSYNFLVFAVIPYLWFRRKYSNLDLNLVSTNGRSDWLVLIVVLLLESTVQLLAMPFAFSMRPGALAIAAPLSFVLFLFGTVLPTMVLIYAILLPRYLRLTSSPTMTVILGGLTYALMHLVEGWSTFRTPSETALSLLFVFVSYTGPGMFKSFVTLRTGNAWIHAIGYHAIAPHTIIDAPNVAKVFAIK
ncbi:MAG: hypothetical protein M3N05_00175 [Pseudomonadota bacterium]|nr:hypothetical protein [Pseudomonadota bacterium]